MLHERLEYRMTARSTACYYHRSSFIVDNGVEHVERLRIFTINRPHWRFSDGKSPSRRFFEHDSDKIEGGGNNWESQSQFTPSTIPRLSVIFFIFFSRITRCPRAVLVVFVHTVVLRIRTKQIRLSNSTPLPATLKIPGYRRQPNTVARVRNKQYPTRRRGVASGASLIWISNWPESHFIVDRP